MRADIPEWAESVAVAVNELVRECNALPRFRAMIRQWKTRHDARDKAERKWEAARRKHFERLAKSPADAPLRTEAGNPPKPGWKYEMCLVVEKVPTRTVPDPDGKGTVKVAEGIPRIQRLWGWTPPRLSVEKCPVTSHFARLERPLKLDEKYTLLAALHDCLLAPAVPKIDPWESKARRTPASVREHMTYYVLTQPDMLMPNIAERKAALTVILAEVTEDLKARPGQEAAGKSDDESPFYKPAYFKQWNIGDELLRRNATDGKKYVEGKVRRTRKKPSSGKGKRVVYWYSEADARKRWPDRFAPRQD